MSLKLARTIILCMLFCSIITFCSAQNKFEEWIASDMQLKKTVTLQESKITIGEALESFSKQTGVKILMDANKEESGVILFVQLKNAPLSNCLEAISSLLSLPGSKWQWGRNGDKNLWTYKLYPANLSDLNTALMFQARMVFKDYINFLRGYVALSPEEQDKQKSLYSKAMLQKSDEIANSYLDARKTGLISRMKVMLELLDDQGIDAVLDGGAVTLPLAKLSETQKASMLQFYDQYHLEFTQNGVPVLPPSPEPTSMTIYSIRSRGSKKDVMPNILLSVGESGALTCLGPGVSGGFIQSLGRAWILPGDLQSHPLEETLIPDAKIENKTIEVKEHSAQDAKRHNPVDADYERRLTETSILTKIPIIAVLNQEVRQSYVEPANKTTVKKFLDTTEGRSSIKIHKWRKGILLISTPDWMMSQDSIIPVNLMKKMQTLLYRPSKEGLLKEVCSQFVTLSPPQWQGLVEKFPQFSIVFRNRSFFRFASNYPDLFRSTGLILNQDIIQAILSCLPESNRKTLDNARKVRWRTVNAGTKEEDFPVFAFEVLDSKGAWKELVSSAYLSVMDGSDYSPQ